MQVHIRKATRLTSSFRRPLLPLAASSAIAKMTGSANAAKLIDNLNKTYECKTFHVATTGNPTNKILTTQ